MEKKTLIFLLISIAILFLYTQFILPLFIKPVKPPLPKHDSSLSDTLTSGLPISPTLKSELKPVSPTMVATTHPQVKLISRTIETNYLKAVFSNKGACLESLVLKKYDAAEKKEPLELLRDFQQDKYSLILKQIPSGTVQGSLPEMENINWEILSSEEPKSICFRYNTPDGLVLKKIFNLTENSYAIDVKIVLENTSGQDITAQFQLTGAAGISYERTDRHDLVGIRGYTDKNKKWGVKDERSQDRRIV
ncbi:MAG: membrane protein insertase YidC [Planctomycetota bacterium]